MVRQPARPYCPPCNCVGFFNDGYGTGSTGRVGTVPGSASLIGGAGGAGGGARGDILLAGRGLEENGRWCCVRLVTGCAQEECFFFFEGLWCCWVCVRSVEGKDGATAVARNLHAVRGE